MAHEPIIDQLENFKTLASKGMTPVAYNETASAIESGLLKIEDFQTSVDALELLDELRKNGYLLKQCPDQVNELVVPAIQDLIDFLKAKPA